MSGLRTKCSNMALLPRGPSSSSPAMNLSRASTHETDSSSDQSSRQHSESPCVPIVFGTASARTPTNTPEPTVQDVTSSQDWTMHQSIANSDWFLGGSLSVASPTSTFATVPAMISEVPPFGPLGVCTCRVCPYHLAVSDTRSFLILADEVKWTSHGPTYNGDALYVTTEKEAETLGSHMTVSAQPSNC